MTDSERLDWLEERTRRSPTGISFDWIPSVDGERSGFRFMRRHFISDPAQSLRSAIDKAAAENPIQRLEKAKSSV